ncbi:hypothetical protein ACQUSR_28025 [Streptomyces sp. P1-3]|uniref:hypothetical protein n=1 Tax=Streptomyces sp. P1-3 TaxID=3421658 RepID=UPI003D36773F
MPLTATRIQADTATVIVASRTAAVTEWARRYFGPWWNAAAVAEPDSGDIADGGAVVCADTDPDLLEHIRARVTGHGHEETIYANARTLTARHDGVVYAVQPEERIAYRADGQRIVIAGVDAESLTVAAARLARELVRAQLLADGWSILHASAAARDGRAVLTLGRKGAGKTTTAMLLARTGEWGLLANDRVFVRPEAGGRVQVLPWPAAAAIGLGLLHATGLYEQVRERVLAGEQLHPTQHRRVTEALRTGARRPLWREDGKELKAQFFPDQLASWLGLTLATEAHAAGLLFPSMSPQATPAVLDEHRALSEGDFFTSGTEDRYPDVFGLTPTTTTDVEAVVEHLVRVPHRVLALSHDTDANTALVAKTANEIAAGR